MYDRCIDFDESKADSIKIYAGFIEKQCAKLNYSRGEVLYSRLYGLSEDLKGDYNKALVYYLQSLDAARKLQAVNYEEAALGDLAYIYVNTKQPARAKDIYLQSAKLAESGKDLHSIITAYGNLGAIYNQLKQLTAHCSTLIKDSPLPNHMKIKWTYLLFTVIWAMCTMKKRNTVRRLQIFNAYTSCIPGTAALLICG